MEQEILQELLKREEIIDAINLLGKEEFINTIVNLTKPRVAKLYFEVGPMSSGKTTMALQVLFNYNAVKKNVLLIKPSIDAKGDKSVVPRMGGGRLVDVLLRPEDKVIDYIDKNYDAIIVDEAQFLTEAQVLELHLIASIGGIPVLCYGLAADFQENLFPGSRGLFAHAEVITERKTICNYCGNRKATRNLRLHNGIPIFQGKQIAIDGIDEDYMPVCANCYYKMREEYDESFVIDDRIKRIRYLKNGR